MTPLQKGHTKICVHFESPRPPTWFCSWKVDRSDTHASCLGLYQWQLASSLCVCLVYQWQCQFAAAAGDDDDDDDDDKVANDAVTVCLVLEITRTLVLAVTDARVCCPVFISYAYYISACNTLFTWFTISCKQKCSVMLRMHKNRFSPGLRPETCWESSWRSPDPLVGWGGGYPLPISHPSTPVTPRFRRIQWITLS